MGIIITCVVPGCRTSQACCCGDNYYLCGSWLVAGQACCYGDVTRVVGGCRTSQTCCYPRETWLQDKPFLLYVCYLVPEQARLAVTCVVHHCRTSQARYYPCGWWVKDKPGSLLPVWFMVPGQARLVAVGMLPVWFMVAGQARLAAICVVHG